MITAAENRGWPRDVPLSDPRFAGLSIPSVIRPTKIATVEAAQAKRIGRVTAEDQHAVHSAILERARESSQGFGRFVRSLVGLDRVAVTEAFGEFLSAGTATASQIEFVTWSSSI